jgi:hypothetical protein
MTGDGGAGLKRWVSVCWGGDNTIQPYSAQPEWGWQIVGWNQGVYDELKSKSGQVIPKNAALRKVGDRSLGDGLFLTTRRCGQAVLALPSHIAITPWATGVEADYRDGGVLSKLMQKESRVRTARSRSAEIEG